jgi:hypothetical protein
VLVEPNSRVTLSEAKVKGNYQAQLHSDQIVLMVVRREAGPVARVAKDAQRESQKMSLGSQGI